jgi:hypothetical protein
LFDKHGRECEVFECLVGIVTIVLWDYSNYPPKNRFIPD